MQHFTMQQLCKKNELTSDMQYYQTIVDRLITRQLEQAREFYCAMQKSDRITFLKAISIARKWNHRLSDSDVKAFFDTEASIGK